MCFFKFLKAFKFLFVLSIIPILAACKMTSEIDLGVNLPADAPALQVSDFDPADSSTYTDLTTFDVIDSRYKKHEGALYFVKSGAAANSWAMFFYVDGEPVPIYGGRADLNVPPRWPDYAEIVFDSTGEFITTVPATITSIELGDPLSTSSGFGADLSTYQNGQDPNQVITIDIRNNGATQYVFPFVASQGTLDITPPVPTSDISLGVNLPAGASSLDISEFDPTQEETYTASTSIDIFDSLGGTHTATLYFVRDQAQTDGWVTFLYVDDQPVDISGGSQDSHVPARWPAFADIVFSLSGSLQNTVPGTIWSIELGDSDGGAGVSTYANGQDPGQRIQISFSASETTQYDAPFTVLMQTRNGRPAGE